MNGEIPLPSGGVAGVVGLGVGVVGLGVGVGVGFAVGVEELGVGVGSVPGEHATVASSAAMTTRRAVRLVAMGSKVNELP